MATRVQTKQLKRPVNNKKRSRDEDDAEDDAEDAEATGIL
jgi:hypothetical protein